MKFLVLFIGYVFFSLGVNGQSFYFIDHETTLIKTVAQSPAHWYIEIYSNEIVDTTLRWKAHFDNVPIEWNISFDDQNNYYAAVNDVDSADFTLFSNLTIPQKLIIGAETNNTPATATVWFEIYDPASSEYRDSIYYHFIISEVNDLDENLMLKADFKLNDNHLEVINASLIGQYYTLYSITGQHISEGKLENEIPLIQGSSFIVVQVNNTISTYRLPIRN